MSESTLANVTSWKKLQIEITKKLSLRRAGPITGIDVDGQVLRIAQTEPRGSQRAVTQIAALPLDLPANASRSDPAALGKAIKDALDRAKIKPAAIAMGVPRALVILRTLSLPVTDDLRELASMVHFQVSKDLPLRLEDAVIDFKIRRQAMTPAPVQASAKTGGESNEASEPVPKLEVLVATVRRDVVTSFQQIAAVAGLKLASLGWLSDANARCAEACHVANGNEGIALVSLRLDEVSIDIIAQNSLIFSRGITIKVSGETTPPASPAQQPATPERLGEHPPSIEASAFTQPENFVETVIIEVVRSVHSYGGIEPHLPVARLFVAGSTGHEPAVVEALKKRLNISCSLLDPTSALALSEEVRKEASGSVSALGLALGANDPQGLHIDFLNPKKPAVQRNTGRIRIMAAAAVAALLLFVLLGVRAHLVNQRLQVNRQILAELTEAEKKRPIYRQMRQQATTVQDWVKQGRDCLEHYTYLTAILPGSEEIYLSSLSISGQGSIRFAVQARSGEILAKLDKQLRAAGYDIKPLAITPGTDKFGYNFRSTVELSATDKLKIDLTKVQPPPRPADDTSAIAPAKAARRGGAP
jgi:Tfp pilus assembly PilM family ATPase